METKRRRFLAMMGTFGVLSAAVPKWALARVSPTGDYQSSTAPGESLSDSFRARIRDWFYLFGEGEGHPGEVRLVGVRNRGNSEALEQFSLIFVGRRNLPALADGYYTVAGETFSLFIKYIGSRRGKCRYSADFAVLK